ncbi:thioredoxin-disulfide reductase [Spirochaeta africana]|uniref:Thioredoxin reductase n=1 Tax=Spirochaeta africana (strain ATCC 700263 / DSM 8902 / Z-7692) TaxID=889378 RepID=H9UH16_SPIAZ|nr:thioredoxin-disulfide reductase [Spirochaeta africana]AFG36809.1 thioredoxin-disulfide reductase [Spirochaeta africana DSM 8902]
MADTRKVIIIGSGPAAHTAAIYAARAELQPLLFEGFMAGGVAAGGQLTTTTEVENFPGFPEGISGPALMDQMRAQSLRFGTEIKTETVSAVDMSKRPFTVTADSGEYLAEAVIVSTGATAKRLQLPGEDRLWQRGISACAVCDGALPLFRNQPLVVIGGGDSAAEEASFLTKYGSSVTMLVRRDELRASKAMQKRVFENEKITVMWNTEAQEVLGEKMLEQVRVRNNKTGEEQLLPAKGLFYAIGHKPNTDFLGDALDKDETGYLVTVPGTTRTNVPGVFACGDVQDKHYRQAVTAAGSGCMAALDAEKFLIEE